MLSLEGLKWLEENVTVAQVLINVSGNCIHLLPISHNTGGGRPFDEEIKDMVYRRHAPRIGGTCTWQRRGSSS